MAKCILLHEVNPSQNSFDEGLNLSKAKHEEFIKKENNIENPFVILTEFPMLLHNKINENHQLISNSVCLYQHRLNNKSIEEKLNEKDLSKKLIYLKTLNGELEIIHSPVIYNPSNFMPIKDKLIRFGTVDLSDKEVEKIIIENRYYSKLIRREDKLFYFDMVTDNLDIDGFKLFEIKNDILNDEEYSIYSELIKRLGIPRSKTIFNNWINQIKGDKKITTQNNNYMYTLIGRNGKYTR
jgi:hypothetical protein